ncbi:transcriptional enhancer factor TEF-4 isoform X2 [Erythrolamprus reginae]|uniref:transcriptional enhancer factor TEF-4 isoform X2 n=1 Tax=Erythrolamprus reginae TaxID=121349 RepID=UPI00396CA39E
MGDAGAKSLDSDAEGVWSMDIEQSFQQALAIYPPCGRRKIILSDEGKMYGRNELIARYIKLKTGKIRTRKQVSSHIQVLARRKSREIQTKLKDQVAKDKALQSMAVMSSAQLISTTVFQEKLALLEPQYISSTITRPADFFQLWAGNVNQDQIIPDIKPILQAPYFITPNAATPAAPGNPISPGMSLCLPSLTTSCPRSHIGTETLRLVEFTAFMEWQNDQHMFKRQHRFVHIDPTPTCEPSLEMVDIRQIYDKFPEEGGGLRELYDQGPPQAFFLVKFWADLSFSLLGEVSGGRGGAFYGTAEPPHWENDRFVFRMKRSPLCEYLINFIRKLQTLPEKLMMDSVLENFTILQVLRDQETQELLLCVAFVFEVSASERGAQHHIYRLGQD